MNRKILFVELVHSLLWMNKTKGQSHKHREAIDTLNFVPNLQVENKSYFTIEVDDELPSRLEKFLRKIQVSGICTLRNSCYGPWAKVEIHFKGRDLRTCLCDANIGNFIQEGELVSVFLEEAANFDSSFESSIDGRRALAALPVDWEWFTPPHYFAEPVNTLLNAGYCETNALKYRWTEKVRPQMEAALLWVGDKTSFQLREEELLQIWNTMPERFRMLFAQQAREKDSLDVINLAMIMGHFRYDGEWHEKPENLEGLRQGILPGGQISTATELNRLFKSGKIAI